MNDTMYDRVMANRYYKMNPHEIEGIREYDISVYADGSFSLVNPEALLGLCKGLYESPESAIFFRHPDRQTPNKELKEVVRRGIISPEDGAVAEKRMFDNGFDGNENTLTENGFMIRKHNNRELIKCMEYWWKEFRNGPKRDQISLQYSMFKTGYSNYKLMTCQDKLKIVKFRRHGE